MLHFQLICLKLTYRLLLNEPTNTISIRQSKKKKKKKKKHQKNENKKKSNKKKKKKKKKKKTIVERCGAVVTHRV